MMSTSSQLATLRDLLSSGDDSFTLTDQYLQSLLRRSSNLDHAVTLHFDKLMSAENTQHANVEPISTTLTPPRHTQTVASGSRSGGSSGKRTRGGTVKAAGRNQSTLNSFLSSKSTAQLPIEEKPAPLPELPIAVKPEPTHNNATHPTTTATKLQSSAANGTATPLQSVSASKARKSLGDDLVKFEPTDSLQLGVEAPLEVPPLEPVAEQQTSTSDLQRDGPNVMSEHFALSASSSLATTDKPAPPTSGTAKLTSVPRVDSPAIACWSRGQPTPYQHLSRTFAKLEPMTNRRDMMNLFTMMLWHILDQSPADLTPAIFLSTNQLEASYLNVSMGVGGGSLSSVIRSITGISRPTMSREFAQLGDLGLLARQHAVSQPLLQKPPPLTVRYVHQTLKQIASISGKDSVKHKERLIQRLMLASAEDEICYLVRTFEGELRVGVVITTALSAIAKAAVLHAEYHDKPTVDGHVATWERVLGVEAIIQFNSPIAAMPAALRPLGERILAGIKSIRKVYSYYPNIRGMVDHITTAPDAIFTLEQHCKLSVGVPLKPMLARIAKSWADIFRIFNHLPFSAEIKYDGLRAQIHYQAPMQMRIYSRHMLDQTARWHDLLPVLQSSIQQAEQSPTSFILDVEIVAIEREKTEEAAGVDEKVDDGSNYRILPFQELATRKRGQKKQGKDMTDMSESAASKQALNDRAAIAMDELALLTPGNLDDNVSVMIVAFDVLLLDGVSLMQRSLRERRQTMQQSFKVLPGQLEFTENTDAITLPDVPAPDAEPSSPTPRKKTTTAANGGSGSGKKKGRITNVHETDSDDGDHSDVEAKKADGATSDTETQIDRYGAELSPAQQEVVEKLQKFLMGRASQRGEGLMLKSLDAIYEPDVRTDKWVKVKKDYVGGITVDSFDAVPIGGFNGMGRKAGFISPWLLAVWDPVEEEWQTLCKVMSGMTDEEYQILTKRFKEKHMLSECPSNYNITDGLRPSYYWKPAEVWEIRGADLTISPNHTAAMNLVTPNKGIGLRFPRFIRIRTGKSVYDCTTSSQISQLYQAQGMVAGRAEKRFSAR